MRKSFEYLFTVRAEDVLEVEDIGNTCIHALNDAGYEWYLTIESKLGDTYIKEFGPFNVDIDNYFPFGFEFKHYKFQYSEKKLTTIITKFMNDQKRLITQAFTCEIEEAYDKIKYIDLRKIGDE